MHNNNDFITSCTFNPSSVLVIRESNNPGADFAL